MTGLVVPTPWPPVRGGGAVRSRQCALLAGARSSFYYRPRPERTEELELLERLDRIFTDHPVYGSRRLQVALLREGIRC